MHEYRFPTDDYILVLKYRKKLHRLHLKRYYSDKEESDWHLRSKSMIIDLHWNNATRMLSQNLLVGQPPLPADFMQILQSEYEEMHSS
jgi:hypothetical protein